MARGATSLERENPTTMRELKSLVVQQDRCISVSAVAMVLLVGSPIVLPGTSRAASPAPTEPEAPPQFP
jgi:hypothetical protein